MNELMVHVERIVKPIVATQRRKLRIRMELLAHLQATVAEERDRDRGDENAAIERALIRLGEPAELTRQLQQTVPTVERVLLARVPMSRGLERLELRLGHTPGQRGPMTMKHKTILSAMATLICLAAYVPMFSALRSSGMQIKHPILSPVVNGVGVLGLLGVCYQFCFAGAGPQARFDWRGTFKRGAGIAGLQVALTFLAVYSIADRWATVQEVVGCAGLSVVLLVMGGVVARAVGVARRPYDDWLKLSFPEFGE